MPVLPENGTSYLFARIAILCLAFASEIVFKPSSMNEELLQHNWLLTICTGLLGTLLFPLFAYISLLFIARQGATHKWNRPSWNGNFTSIKDDPLQLIHLFGWILLSGGLGEFIAIIIFHRPYFFIYDCIFFLLNGALIILLWLKLFCRQFGVRRSCGELKDRILDIESN